MPGTPKQERFFRALAHGWKPTHAPYKGKDVPSQAVAKKWVADLAHGGEVGQTCPNCGYNLGGDAWDDPAEDILAGQDEDVRTPVEGDDYARGGFVNFARAIRGARMRSRWG